MSKENIPTLPVERILAVAAVDGGAKVIIKVDQGDGYPPLNLEFHTAAAWGIVSQVSNALRQSASENSQDSSLAYVKALGAQVIREGSEYLLNFEHEDGSSYRVQLPALGASALLQALSELPVGQSKPDRRH